MERQHGMHRRQALRVVIGTVAIADLALAVDLSRRFLSSLYQIQANSDILSLPSTVSIRDSNIQARNIALSELGDVSPNLAGKIASVSVSNIQYPGAIDGKTLTVHQNGGITEAFGITLNPNENLYVFMSAFRADVTWNSGRNKRQAYIWQIDGIQVASAKGSQQIRSLLLDSRQTNTIGKLRPDTLSSIVLPTQHELVGVVASGIRDNKAVTSFLASRLYT